MLALGLPDRVLLVVANPPRLPAGAEAVYIMWFSTVPCWHFRFGFGGPG